MELEEMKNAKKISKLKVFPKISKEQIFEQLKNLQQVKEFRIDLSYYDQLGLVFDLASTFLRDQKELTKLEIEISSINLLNLDSTLYKLKDLNTLTDLTLKFLYLEQCNSNKYLSLSQCFQNCTNLVQFSLSINLEFLNKNENLFRLNELYLRNPNLRKLEISMNHIDEKSLVSFSILEGIRLLKDLESFDFKIFLSHIKMFIILDCLKEELKDMLLLKHLKLYFGWNCFIEYSDLKIIGSILKQLRSLESLELIASYSQQQLKMQEMGIENSLVTFSNLKTLSLDLSNHQTKQFRSVIKIISQMKSLEKVKLNLNIDNPDTYGDNLELYGQSLAEIQNLFSLSINFAYSCQIKLNQLVNFITTFYQLQNLQELSINSGFVKNSNQEQQQDKSKLIEVVSKLKEFRFNIYYIDVDNQEIEENIVDAIVASEQLEKITFQITDCRWDSQYFHKHKLFENLIDRKNKLKQIKIIYPLPSNISEQNEGIIQRLGQNTQLERINLHFKNINQNCLSLLSQLNNSLMNLSKLIELEIEFGTKFLFDDSSVIQLTEALRQMLKLQRLNIDINKDGLKMKSINIFTSTLQYLKKLVYLDLKIQGSEFSDEEEQIQFAKYFHFPPKAYYLNLRLEIRKLKFKKIEDIFERISNLVNLSYLNIHFKEFDLNQFDCVRLKTYFSNLKRIKTINLNHYMMGLLHLIGLFQEIACLQKISLLNTYEQLLSCKVYASRKRKYSTTKDGMIPTNNDVLEDNISLQIKNIYLFAKNEFENNKFESLSYIFHSLELITKLELFIHRNNRVGNAFANQLCHQLKSLQNLQSFSLDIQEDNLFGSESLNQLGTALKCLPQLKKLFLTIKSELNNIDWKINQDFILNLGNLCELMQFQISLYFEIGSQDQIRFEIIQQLCQSIQQMKKLSTLKIQLANVELKELQFDQLKQLFETLKPNLQNLIILLDIKTSEHNKLMLNSVYKLENLQIIELYKLKFHSNQLRKLKRLIKIKESILNDILQ